MKKKGLLLLLPLAITALVGCNNGGEQSSSTTVVPPPTSSTQDLYPPKQYIARASVPVSLSTSGANYLSVDFTFDDKDFDASATKFNRSLALSSYLAACSSDNDLLWRNFYSSIGFGGYKAGKDETKDFIVAYKFVNDYAVVAPAIRSFGYRDGWVNNVTMGLEGNHNGFEESTEILLSMVDDIQELQGKKMKFWLTGFSRGGAIASLLATHILDEQLYGVSEDDVFCYSFEAPAYITQAKEYDNIFNFSNDCDLIPRVIPEEYGLTTNGVKIDISYDGIDELVKGIGCEMEPFTPDETEGYEYATLPEFLSKFISALLIEEQEETDIHYSLSSRAKYVENYQSKLVYTLGLVFKMPAAALAGMIQEIQNDESFVIKMMFYGGVDNPLYKLIKKYLDLYEVEYDNAELEANVAPLIDQLIRQIGLNVASKLNIMNMLSPLKRAIQFHYPEVDYLLLKHYLAQ